jgi:hypothetical protein
MGKRACSWPQMQAHVLSFLTDVELTVILRADGSCAFNVSFFRAPILFCCYLALLQCAACGSWKARKLWSSNVAVHLVRLPAAVGFPQTGSSLISSFMSYRFSLLAPQGWRTKKGYDSEYLFEGSYSVTDEYVSRELYFLGPCRY